MTGGSFRWSHEPASLVAFTRFSEKAFSQRTPAALFDGFYRSESSLAKEAFYLVKKRLPR